MEVKIQNKKIKIALIGCGRIAERHLDAIKFHKEAIDLVAICDLDDNRLDYVNSFINDNINANHRVRKFNSYEDLILEIKNKKLNLDLIVLLTPSGMHPKQTCEAARLGINICTEKPMATNWEEGLEMVKICKINKVKLYVVKQNRFNKTLKLLKNQIQSGRFGKLSLVTLNVFWQRPQEYYDQSEWRGTKNLDGGALMNQASHYVDLLDWLIGPMYQLNAYTATLGRSIEVEDTAVLNLKWRNGALGTMAVTMLTYPKNLEGSITILGENGTAKIGGKAVNEIEIWDFKEKSNLDNEIKEASYHTTSVYGFGHRPYYESMIKDINGKETDITKGEDGLKSLEILVAAYRSARDNCFVEFPLVR